MRFAALLVSVVFLGTACGSSHALKGSIHVVEQLGLGSETRIGQPCSGTGGFDDLHAGAAVTVRDETNKILATGSLDAGKIVSLETCGFEFNVAGIADANFYQVEVSHRGAVTFSKSDLDKQSWTISLSLG